MTKPPRKPHASGTPSKPVATNQARTTTQIAGGALSRGWNLVTANTKEFSRVSGLKLEDWTMEEVE